MEAHIKELIEICKDQFVEESADLMEKALNSYLERNSTKEETKKVPPKKQVESDEIAIIKELYNKYVLVNDNNRFMYSLTLQKQLCATTMKSLYSIGPSDEELELALGPEHTKFIITLSKLISKLFPEMTFMTELQKVIENNESPAPGLADKLRAHIADMQKMVDAVNTQINYLEMIIAQRKEQAQKKVEANQDEVDAINDLVAKLHSEDNATQANDAYELYSDGEIMSTKGGELYGLRSKFQRVCPMILAPVFKFPLKKGNFTYAILKREDCYAIRERMAKLSV
jgi:hypothetical protein